MTKQEKEVAEELLDTLESLLIATIVEVLEGKANSQQARSILGKIGTRITFGSDIVSNLLFGTDKKESNK